MDFSFTPKLLFFLDLTLLIQPCVLAIVRLYPLDVLDVLPYRSLVFTSDTDYVDIGRASKREKKNLMPTNHNGLFDSRVMSRNHARLRVCLDKKV
jgi:hypothetical protein